MNLVSNFLHEVRKDSVRLYASGEIRKFAEDCTLFKVAQNMKEFNRRFTPFEVRIYPRNLFLDEGLDYIWRLICGDSACTPFDHDNAFIGVGSSNTPAAHDDLGLQGEHRTYVAMDDGFPSYPPAVSASAEFRASFGELVGNHVWNEWTIANGDGNGSDIAVTNLNRKVESFGTKDGGSWQLSLTLELRSS